MRNPGLARPRLLAIYRSMALARLLAQRLDRLSEERGGGAGGHAAEPVALSVGCASSLSPEDPLASAPAGRSWIGPAVVRGVEVRDILLEGLSRAGSPSAGRAAGLTDAGRGLIAPHPVPGGMVPVMAGIALAFRLRGEGRVAAACIAGAEMTTGHFHEGMSLAAVRRAPLVVVVQDAPPPAAPGAGRGPVEHEAAYGVPSFTVAGDDVMAVVERIREAAGHARGGGGPVLVRARAAPASRPIRRSELADTGRRVDERRRPDPLDAYRGWLMDAGDVADDELESIDAQLAGEVERAEREAAAAPAPGPADAAWPDAGGEAPREAEMASPDARGAAEPGS